MIRSLILLMLSLLVPGFLRGADLELSSDGVRCGFSPRGGSLASVEVDGVRYDVGQPSFVAYLYSPQGTDAELCEDLSDVMFATAGLNAKTVVAGNKLNFNFRSAGFPGLTVRKSYELTTDAAGRVALDLRILLKNGGDKPLALSLRTKSALLVGEGKNTIYLPDEADGHDAFPYPGSAGRHRASLRPRLNTIGVADEKGRGFVLSVPPRCASCLLVWLEQKHGRLATQEHYGTVETLAPGEKRVQSFRLTFVPDVPAALRELSKPNLPLRGELSPHVRKFETPPKSIVTIPVGGASSAFKTPRERLEKGMKVPLDILSHVSPDDVAYPHAPWFKPGRPIRLLYLYDPDSSMIVNGKILLREIAARTPVEPTVVPVFREMLGIRGKDKPYSVYNAFFGNRTDPWSEDELKRVRTGDYDVVLVHRIDFKKSSPVCTEVLRDIASRGAGLVFAACPNVPDELMSGPDDAALAARVQVPRMRKVKGGFFRFVRAADGIRVAFDPKDRAANPCIPPDFQKDYEAAVYSRDFPYHDYTLFGITKAVRIASRGTADALIASAADGKAVIDVRTPGTYRLETAYRDVHRYVDAVVTNAVTLAAGEQTIAWTRPCVPGGTAVCELRLLDSAGSVVDAAAVRTDAPVVATLEIEPTAQDGIYDSDEPIRFTVTCSGAAAEGTLVAEFEDSDFRVLRRESRPSAATADVSFAPVVNPGSIARLVVRLEREGHVLARAVKEISIRARPLDLKDVSAYLTITPELGVYPLVRDLGFDFTIANFMNARSAGSVRGAANLGLASVPRNCGAKAEWFRPYRGDDPKGSAVRTPCFSDPAWQAEVAGRIRQAAAEFRYDFYNVRCHWLGDECFLGSTVCYSPTCLKGFRAAMRAKYGTVAALNARWGTSFASFDDVKPVQLSELSGRDNLAPWLEHKMFMARQFADRWVGDTKAALNAAVPGVRAGPTGTAPPGYGWDWSQMMRHIDAIGYYGGAQRKLIHDFAAEWGHDLLAGQCGGGYTPGGPDYEPFNYDRIWSGLLRGANLAPHYFGAAVDGDYSATSNMLYFSRSVTELKGGIGKFWLSTTGTPCVAVLYSQPSLFAAMATTGANTWQNALTSWWRILSDIKVDFTYLSYGRLAERGVPDGCRLLVLPDALALSDAERRGIAAFQARGGKVFADVEPGVYDEAGVRCEKPLADVRLFGRELTDYTAVDLGGAAGETDTTTFGNAELAARLRKEVRAALAEIGIRPEVSVTDANGREFPCDAFLRADGENRAFALHLDTDAKTGKGRFNLKTGTPVTVRLPFKSFVYDVRSGENLGFTDEIRTTVVPGYTRMYSLQRKAPRPLTVEAPKSVAHGAAAHVVASVSGSVGPQVFGFRVYDPDGRIIWRQRKNVRTTATSARAEFVFETAFNERPGDWRIVVRHVNTGTEKTVVLKVGEDAPLLRFGVMTDTHVRKTIESCSRVRQALELFRDRGCSLVINAGDIADNHFPSGYEAYRTVSDEVFAGCAQRPREFFAYAFHDAVFYKGHPRSDVFRDAPQAFEDVRRLLKVENAPLDEKTVSGFPFLIFPQFVGYEKEGFIGFGEYERRIAAACAANPGKPVFVVDHIPAGGVLGNQADHGGVRGAILAKYPQVVYLCGHKHYSVRDPRMIWQGGFTALNAGCLQNWSPRTFARSESRREGTGVLTVEVFADRLEVRRWDVRDGSEIDPAHVWRVPLPFEATSAPYAEARAAAREPVPAFPADASLGLAFDAGSFDGLSLRFPAVGAAVYRVEVERKRENGGWTRQTWCEVAGDLCLDAAERSGTMTARLEPSLFDPDDEIRLAVTPVNAFGVAGSVALRSRTVRVPRPAKAAQEVLRWSASEVRDHLVAEGDRFAKDAADAGRVTAKETGTARVRLPAGLFASAAGTPWRVVVDMESRGRVTVALGNANGARGAGPRFDTHGMDTGPVRYVLPFEMPREGKPEASDSYDLVLGCYAPSCFRIASIRVERP